jgi:phospholipase/carboxylesterase
MLSGPTVAAVNGAPKQLIVFLHGYGANGDDLIGLSPYFSALLPDAMFISPHGVHACEMGPFGRQWFSLGGWQPGLDWPAQAWPEILSTGKIINHWLDDMLAEHNIPPSQLVLVGFSQGTMMALHAGLRRAIAPAAIIGYSGALMGRDVLAADITARPPVLLVHGEADPIVPFAEMAAAEKTLLENNVPVQTYARPGLPHGIDDAGIARAAQFAAGALVA